MREQHGAIVRAQLAEAHRRRDARSRSPPGRRSTATAPSAAPPPISSCRRLPPARSRLRATEQLRSFYNERKATFRAPEYRAVNVVAVDAAETLAKPEAVSRRGRPQALRARQGQLRRARAPHHPADRLPDRGRGRGRLQPDQGRRDLRGDRGGAQHRREGPRARHLHQGRDDRPGRRRGGLRARAGRRERPGRRAGSAPCSSGSRMSSPRASGRFEEVAAELRREIAQSSAPRAPSTMSTTRSRISAPAPAAGRDRQGERPAADVHPGDRPRRQRDKAGSPIANLPERDALLAAAFASDIGVDNEAARASRTAAMSGIDVTGIEPARDKTLDEVRDAGGRAVARRQVVAAPLREGARARERLDKGEAIEAVAADAGAHGRRPPTDLAAQRRQGRSLGRGGQPHLRGAGRQGRQVADAGNDNRAVFKVTAATVPPFVTTTQEAAAIDDQLRTGLGDDLIAEYVRAGRARISASPSTSRRCGARSGSES